MIGDRLLCDAGRCARILEGLAAADRLERIDQQYGDGIADVIRGVLTELGVDASDDTVGSMVARHCRRVMEERAQR